MSSSIKVLAGGTTASSDWNSSLVFTPNNFGTITNNQLVSRRIGDTLQVRGSFTSSSNAGSWALMWCMVRVFEKNGSGIFKELAVKFWRWRFNKVWGNPGNMFANYFNNPSHPIAIYLKNSK